MPVPEYYESHGGMPESKAIFTRYDVELGNAQVWTTYAVSGLLATMGLVSIGLMFKFRDTK